MHKVIWQIVCKRYVFLGPKWSKEKNISKCRCFHADKLCWTFFLVLSSSPNLKEQFVYFPRCILTVFVWVIKFFLQYVRDRYEQTFQKKAFFRVTKAFGQLFLVLSSVKKLQEQIVRFHKVFWPLMGKIYDHSFGTQEVQKKCSTKSFFLRGKKFWASFFSNYSVGHTSKNNLKGSSWKFHTYCAIYKGNSMGPRRSLESNISKKGFLSVDKSFPPVFSPIIERNKPQETV